MLNQIQSFIEKTLSPAMTKLSGNKFIRSMSTAMMRAMPVLLGSAVFSLLADFPITAVPNFLEDIGILDNMKNIVTTLNNINPILFVAMYCYTYAKESEVDATPNLLFGIVVYFILMPSSLTVGEEVITTYSAQYMAGNGMFVALFIGIIVSFIYVFMMKKNITFRLPESVPSMVSTSFAPIFVGIAIIGFTLLVDFGISFTSYGNVFDFVVQVIQAPIVAVGANIPFMILFYTFLNLLWFFGIHPSALTALYVPVIRIMFAGNIGAAMQGQELPYVKEYLSYMIVGVGGAGGLLGLGIIMLFFSKSNRFKAAAKVGAIPVVFNINEPIMFATPVVMNSIFLIPMLLQPLMCIGTMYVMTNMITIKFNMIAAMAIPWTMPYPITAFIAGGIPLLLIMLLIIAMTALLYFPFFKLADRTSLAEEKALEMNK